MQPALQLFSDRVPWFVVPPTLSNSFGSNLQGAGDVAFGLHPDVGVAGGVGFHFGGGGPFGFGLLPGWVFLFVGGFVGLVPGVGIHPGFVGCIAIVKKTYVLKMKTATLLPLRNTVWYCSWWP